MTAVLPGVLDKNSPFLSCGVLVFVNGKINKKNHSNRLPKRRVFIDKQRCVPRTVQDGEFFNGSLRFDNGQKPLL